MIWPQMSPAGLEQGDCKPEGCRVGREFALGACRLPRAWFAVLGGDGILASRAGAGGRNTSSCLKSAELLCNVCAVGGRNFGCYRGLQLGLWKGSKRDFVC